MPTHHDDHTVQDKPLTLGVSSCLLGNNVRYDGGHKLDRFVRDVLGQYARFVPVCPEMECGMPTPRESLRLVGDPAEPRLVTRTTGVDWTDVMQDWTKVRLRGLTAEKLHGFIFRAKSPSSGMERVKVYQGNGSPVHTGVGIFAREVMGRFPLLPVEDDGRLNDEKLREMFIERVFVHKRWQELLESGLTRGKLVEFHTRHKMLILSHHMETYRQMGKLVAGTKGRGMEELAEEYGLMLHRALSFKTTVKKNVNVLTHIMGHFKKELTADEKQELLEIIDHYHKEHLPLVVPVTLVNHYVRKYGKDYLAAQHYLNPHPVELRLRNRA